jgi:type VI secretion system protein ImpF
MTAPDIRERLQPALLDRLIDNARDQRSEADEQRTMSKPAMRAAILRDLGWLLNAVQPLGKMAQQKHALLATSVLGYGLPPMSGQLASKVDVALLEREIHDAILRFEPRILAHDLTVRALESTGVLDTHNVIEFEIKGSLWAQPVPLELLLRTQVDLEDGQVQLRDMTPVTSVAALRGQRP